MTCANVAAERPLSESESLLLSQICSWNRKVVVVLNKMDITREEDRPLLMDYVSQNVARIVGSGSIEPVRVFPVSGRQALDALANMSPDSISGTRTQLLRKSNVPELKSYLAEILSAENIVREKLLNPIRMMDRIVDVLSSKLTDREQLIEGDERIIEFIAENMTVFSAAIRGDAKLYQQKVQHQQNQMKLRCTSFIDKQLSPLNARTILDSAALAQAFQDDVLLDMGATVTGVQTGCVDLFESRSRQQRRAVMQYVSERARRHESKIFGSVDMFEDEGRGASGSSAAALPGMGLDVSVLLSDFSPKREADQLTRSLSMAAMFSGGSVAAGVLGAGACYLGGFDVLASVACAMGGASGVSVFLWQKNSLR
jgi:hypothetical protein